MSPNVEEKLGPIRRYLRMKFLGHAVEDSYFEGPLGQLFTVERGSVLYRVRIAQEFLDGHAPAEIADLLQKWDLATALQRAGTRMLQVTNTGIQPG